MALGIEPLTVHDTPTNRSIAQAKQDEAARLPPKSSAQDHPYRGRRNRHRNAVPQSEQERSVERNELAAHGRGVWRSWTPRQTRNPAAAREAERLQQGR